MKKAPKMRPLRRTASELSLRHNILTAVVSPQRFFLYYRARTLRRGTTYSPLSPAAYNSSLILNKQAAQFN